jgi:cellulose synthase operon protein YhjQ
MTLLALSGLRGGVGCTSLVAALGFALQALGQRVLLLDLQPRNLLRLHCNMGLPAPQGWARSELDGEPWSDALLQVMERLYLLPFGRLDEAGHAAPAQHPAAWPQRLQQLQQHFDWIVLDLPGQLPLPGLRHLRVLEADAACHALLNLEGPGQGHLLINRFDPVSQLQRDLLLLWSERLQGRLVPQVIHRDEAMAGALAWKSPLGHYGADSLAARDVRSLATWLLAQEGG